MITIKQKGNFNNTEKFFKNVVSPDYIPILEKYARQGVEALTAATPVESGETANSWGYEISQSKKGTSVIWTNSHIVDGVPVVILLQYGHATGSGGYVQGRDFINPALKPIFDQIASNIWREVNRL